ncbi:Hypothetical predicted protein [Prunus dulcis]|uniref:Uncharacterized protein n=1 Tax=Prunus dulcis TaxID=3755 RepID=A0A5E4FZV3_PRUDU|nr:Hypothetical predicted protein [Prunus dulcis]
MLDVLLSAKGVVPERVQPLERKIHYSFASQFLQFIDASAEGLRNDLELVRSSSGKHIKHLRPSA